jgi:beta-lactamase regulating signal transducer with metallopeptidase domain
MITILTVVLKLSIMLACGLAVYVSLRGAHPQWRVWVTRTTLVMLPVLLAGTMFLSVAFPLLPSDPAAAEAGPVRTPVTSVPIALPAASQPRAVIVEMPPFNRPHATLVGTTASPDDVRAGFGGATAASLLWLMGALVGLALVARRALAGHLVARSLVDAPAALQEEFQSLRASLEMLQTARLTLDKSGVGSPYLCGLIRPVIALPAEALDWSVEERAAAMTHELMHIRNRDLAWMLAMEFARALLWWNPLAHALAQCHRRACEDSADLSAASCSGIDEYRTLVARLAVALLYGREPAAGLATMARMSEVRDRLRWLPIHADAPPMRRRRAQMLAGVVVIASFGLGAVRLTHAAEPAAQPNAEPAPQAQVATDRYTPEEIRTLTAEVLLSHVGNQPAGYHQFAPLWALVEKGKADPEVRKVIDAGCIRMAGDQNEPMFRRWVPLYVMSDLANQTSLGNTATARATRDAALKDPSPIVRKVAITALGQYTGSMESEARIALEEVRKGTTDPELLALIAEAAAGKFRKQEAPAILAKTEKEADQRRDLAIRSAALTAALDAEMDRVMIRARDGHSYKDKIDLVYVYETYVKAHPNSTPQSQIVGLRIWFDLNKDRPEYNWRARQLLAHVSNAAGDHYAATNLYKETLAVYPDTQYADPLRHSKFQHLVNEYAEFLWATDGRDSAEAMVLQLLESDGRFDAFHMKWWQDQYKRNGLSTEDLEAFKKRLRLAVEARQVSHPDEAPQIQRMLGLDLQ